MEEIKVSLPDIDQMFVLIREIHDMALERALLEIKIKDQEQRISWEATNNPTYFIAGKTPSQEFIKNSLSYRGFEGELIPLREHLAELSAGIDRRKDELRLLQDIIAIWRTQSANERGTFG